MKVSSELLSGKWVSVVRKTRGHNVNNKGNHKRRKEECMFGWFGRIILYVFFKMLGRQQIHQQNLSTVAIAPLDADMNRRVRVYSPWQQRVKPHQAACFCLAPQPFPFCSLPNGALALVSPPSLLLLPPCQALCVHVADGGQR
jgi:hypothetical protein